MRFLSAATLLAVIYTNIDGSMLLSRLVLTSAPSSLSMRNPILVSAFSHLSQSRTLLNRPQPRSGPFSIPRGTIGGSTTGLSTSTDTPEWTTDRVRSTFVDYFTKTHSHTPVPSSPCAPLSDPTLLFTNAGMNQYKPIFLGQTSPTSPMAGWKSAANSQKCIRAGGKHNDLEDVGKDTYHHTFFEMLGSWSFNGCYWKEQAIDYAWELLVGVYGVDGGRLYATYFEGDKALGLDPDIEARDFWLKYLPKERVIACDAKDNFWEMGETGPCGPCSEIHYDRIGNRDASHLVNADDPDLIEIWNLVFIQYNRDISPQDASPILTSLPDQHVDTGMGLERLVSLLQDVRSNYDIDVFQPIFRAIEGCTTSEDVGPYGGLVLEEDVTLRDTAYRAVADHVRTLAFAIADGVVPSNGGRGYVLRRILRRASRYGLQILKTEPLFLAKVVPAVIDTFGETYPELTQNREKIIEIIQEEELAFSTMLDRGIAYFSDLTGDIQESEAKTMTIPGDKAFFLYDTLGFPIDLTEQMAVEAGFTVDITGFESKMETQKQRSRDARNAGKGLGDGGRLELVAEQTAWLADNDVKATEDDAKFEWDIEVGTVVSAIFTQGGFVSSDGGVGVEEGATVGLILEETSFFAEAGGQLADTGTVSILSDSGAVAGTFRVLDVQSYGGFYLHVGTMEQGSASDLTVGSKVRCEVDYTRRRDIAPNHSMTHVLSRALRQTLGEEVAQRGSLVSEEKLRFDFSNKKALSAKQLRTIEESCKRSVAEGEGITTEVLSLAQAQMKEGLITLAGEIYPDPVRVVTIGEGSSSVEFCGGTHLANTKEAQAFVIVEETAVAKGIRRITAVTKDLALQAIQEGNEFETKVADLEEAGVEMMEGLDKRAGNVRKDLDASNVSAILKSDLRERLHIIQNEVFTAKKKALAGRVDRCLNVVQEQVEAACADGKKMLVVTVDIAADSKAAQKVMKIAKKNAPDMAFMGISEENAGSGGKLMAFALVPEAMNDGVDLKADEWIRNTLEVCGGRGGGKAGNAQGQAPECSDVDEVVSAAISYANAKTGVIT